MTVEKLDRLFRPSSIAVIGASNKANSLGSTVIHNLISGRFAGPVLPVTPKYQAVSGVLTYPDIDSLPLVPDLAIFCTPPKETLKIIERLGAKGCKMAVVLTTDPAGNKPAKTTSFKKELLTAAAPHGMRILGPGSMGLQVPPLNLNASWLVTPSQPGKVAFISQSASVAAGVVDWAKNHNVGFSHVVTAGDASDIDIADILDYFGTRDPMVRAILLYVRSVADARRFMSAARSVSYNKPVIAIRTPPRSEIVRQDSQKGQMAIRPDEVYDAAIGRAGMLRVYGTDEIFDAVETLAKSKTLRGPRLAILSNGRGPGESAADSLTFGGGVLAQLENDTKEELKKLAPVASEIENPVDIGRDATASRFQAAAQHLLKDKNVDALLIMHSSTAIAPGAEVADAIIESVKGTHRNLLACWLGQDKNEIVQNAFAKAKIPFYASPDKAARAFLHLVRYQRNQDLLMEMPSTRPTDNIEGKTTVKKIIADALGKKRSLLDEQETVRILSAYGFKTVPTKIAKGAFDAGAKANAVGYPVALRVCSQTVTREAHMVGMALDLFSEDAVISAAEAMELERQNDGDGIQKTRFVVQTMAPRARAFALRAGVANDPEFGPVITLGLSGSTAQVKGIRACALPPLNLILAGELISRSKVMTFLGEGDFDDTELRRALVRLSQLVIDIPELREIEINPLLVNNKGIHVLEARATLDSESNGTERLAIRPYPRDLSETVQLKTGETATLRAVRPDDGPRYLEFLSQISPEDIRTRFLSSSIEIPKAQVAKAVHIDYDREMTIAAVVTTADGNREIYGVVSATTNPDNTEAEYAVMVRSNLKGTGIGRVLMEKIIAYCKSRNTGSIVGYVLDKNTSMLGLCRKLGFNVCLTDDPDMMEVRLQLLK